METLYNLLNKKKEKLVHLVGFIIRVYHDARSPEHQVPRVFTCSEQELNHQCTSVLRWCYLVNGYQ